MKTFAVIMKYITLSLLMFHTIFFILCIYNGTVLNIITSCINEVTFVINTLIWNMFVEDLSYE